MSACTSLLRCGSDGRYRTGAFLLQREFDVRLDYLYCLLDLEPHLSRENEPLKIIDM